MDCTEMCCFSLIDSSFDCAIRFSDNWKSNTALLTLVISISGLSLSLIFAQSILFSYIFVSISICSIITYQFVAQLENQLKLEEQIKSLSLQNETMQTNLIHQQTLNHDYQTQNQKLEQTHIELTSTIQHYQRIQSQLKQNTTEQQLLLIKQKQEFEHFKSSNKHLKQTVIDLDEKTKELEKLKTRSQELRTIIETLQDVKTRLSSEIDRLGSQISRLEGNLDVINKTQIPT